MRAAQFPHQHNYNYYANTANAHYAGGHYYTTHTANAPVVAHSMAAAGDYAGGHYSTCIGGGVPPSPQAGYAHPQPPQRLATQARPGGCVTRLRLEEATSPLRACRPVSRCTTRTRCLHRDRWR